MDCPRCSSGNLESDRCCPTCGFSRPARCPHCSEELPQTARFCPGCGARVVDAAALVARDAEITRLNPASPRAGAPDALLEGENRIVTVLFADMSQSVEMLRDLHPDDAYALVNRLFNTIVDALIEHGGSVKRFLGDGALGVFGAPHAREADPERAILAALRIRNSARELGIEVTVGINTGAAYVGGVGSDRYQEATVVGAAVNLAARLQAHAAPGEILVGEATYRLACGGFQFSSRLLALKGYPQAVPAYVVERPLLQP
ncbi:MAG: adenylate/guanylate cyclase domain-containing protein, partial [Actinomycetota bacterium]